MKNYSRENRVFRYDVFSTNQIIVKKVRTVRTGFYDEANDENYLESQWSASNFIPQRYLPGVEREPPNKSDGDALRLPYAWKLQIFRCHV